MRNKPSQTSCCIVGGGPAGVMLGYLLARRGLSATVLEKHADFFRDFRGDTVHPSTLEVLHELGLLDRFLKLPHQQLESAGGVFGDFRFTAARFDKLPTRCRFVAVMPQWDFLKFLSEQARRHRSFDLRMQHEVVDLIQENGRVQGVLVRTPEGTEEIRANLVVGCDGRHSTVRSVARLPLTEAGVPIDVLWFRLSRHPEDPEQVFGNINYGKALILINRGDYFQSGLLIRKGSFEQIKGGGLDAFRQTIEKIAPFLSDRVAELHDWNQIKLLSVQINHLRRWHSPGLLCIGDAAHAMSPVFGVGINLAIQDAVATANLLAESLGRQGNADHLLERVQRRREMPALVTQSLQRIAHRGFQSIFQTPEAAHAPLAFRTVVQVPAFQHVMGRIVGVGIRPEHVKRPKRETSRLLGLATGISVGLAVAWRRFQRFEIS